MLRPKIALVSLSDKRHLEVLTRILNKHQIATLSTGKTCEALAGLGVKAASVSSVTGFPELLGGRVKTLHPTIYAGILARKDHQDDLLDLKKEHLQSIDLVVVNLYPFAARLQDGASQDEIIENIDIGGVSLIRAAAKNHRYVALLTSPNDYAALEEELAKNSGQISTEFRLARVRDAFLLTADYDRQIAAYFAQSLNRHAPPAPKKLFAAYDRQELRYGENPHQSGAFYADAPRPRGLAAAKILQGKQISYNNYVDAEAAMAVVHSFKEPACAIIKHAQPCGVAQRQTPRQAYAAAYAADEESAFGGVIAFNRQLDLETAQSISRQFAELVIAPSMDAEAERALGKKKQLRLLVCEPSASQVAVRKINGGWLLQSPNHKTISAAELRWMTPAPKDERLLRDLLFAWTALKFCRSNAVVIAKDCATCGLGIGQTSRVFSVRTAIMRAMRNAKELSGCVLASDGFFPFADSIERIAAAGITAIIQPGGSKRDEEVIEAARQHNISMAFTDYRCFWHG